MVEAAKSELERQSSDSDEMLGSMSSSTSSIQPNQQGQLSQTPTSSAHGPMQAYGPINIPPGTMIRRVQNLPAGAVPIDPSMLPPGMIPVHAKANPNASQGMPRSEIAEHGKPRRISDDSGRASKLGAPTTSLPYSEEDSIFWDEQDFARGKFSRVQDKTATEMNRTEMNRTEMNRMGQAIKRNSPSPPPPPPITNAAEMNRMGRAITRNSPSPPPPITTAAE